MNEPIRVALIYGSTREGRFGPTVANWAAEQLSARPEFEVDPIDPARLDLPDRLGVETPAVRELAARLQRADAFVVVTPEYNHGYPAALKHLIDLFNEEWQAKPVAFVSYGGISGGLRAVEQLRQVFAEVHAVGVRDSVSFAMARTQFDEHGRLQSPDRARRSMTRMLDRLAWWARALKKARREEPYGERAA
jgi:NAD(P)H-dependent FMN reductase